MHAFCVEHDVAVYLRRDLIKVMRANRRAKMSDERFLDLVLASISSNFARHAQTVFSPRNSPFLRVFFLTESQMLRLNDVEKSSFFDVFSRTPGGEAFENPDTKRETVAQCKTQKIAILSANAP